MFLFLISLVFLLLHIVFYKSVKINRILVIFAFLFVCSVYTILAANSTNSKYFYPQKQLQIYPFTGNYYNWLTLNFTKFKLDLGVNENFVDYLTDGIDKKLLRSNKVDILVKNFYDTSIYKNKVYLYFGITPIMLFYLPFYLTTGYFISDHFVVLVSSLLIFLLQMLTYKRILKLLNKNETLTIISVLIFGLCSGIILTYISITIHLISILVSILCSLIAFYIFLLLCDDEYNNLKMFLIGLFLAFAVGARPTSLILVILLFFAIFIINNFNIKSYSKQYFYFFLPLVTYGTILALYNYLRFDSIFDVGFKYQFSPNYIGNIHKNFSFFVQHFFYNIFCLPNFIFTSPYVIFKSYLIRDFEPMVGGIIISPFVISLLVLPKFIHSNLNKTKHINLFLIISSVTSFIYVYIDSYMGSTARYVEEYLFLLLVPGFILFYFISENVNNNKLKNVIRVLFYIFMIFSLYINTNLINCIFLMSKNGLI